MEDFPAAHSMDTMWFAIDADGCVGVFQSGEAGAVPDAAYVGDEYGEVLELLAPGANELDYEAMFAAVAERGAYVYEHDEFDNWLAGPYQRKHAPTTAGPAEIPAKVREHAVKFPGRFAETEDLQPAEHWPSSAWGHAWLDAARTRLAPTPTASAEEYRDEVEAVLHDMPDLDVAPFEGPDVPTATAAAPPRLPWWKRWFS